MSKKARKSLRIIKTDNNNNFNNRDQGPQRPKLKLEDLKQIEALTQTQQNFFNLYGRGEKFMVLHGVAGTGKTLCVFYKAIEEVLTRGIPTKKVVIVRSCVQSREIGHLPGNVEDKMTIYTLPYRQICHILFGRRDAWDLLAEHNMVEFISTSFLRGASFKDSIIVVDEFQNCNYDELSTVITRTGANTKIVFCGDYRQADLKKKNDCSGLHQFNEVAKYVPSHTKLEFGIDDICRSELVKEWIVAELTWKDQNNEILTNHN